MTNNGDLMEITGAKGVEQNERGWDGVEKRAVTACCQMELFPQAWPFGSSVFFTEESFFRLILIKCYT